MEKKPTHLFVYVGHSTQTKNKLQKEFHDYLVSLSGKVVDYDQRGNLVNEIINHSKKLNEKHSRCTSLNVDFSPLHTKDGLMITGYYFTIFQILHGYNDSN